MRRRTDGRVSCNPRCFTKVGSNCSSLPRDHRRGISQILADTARHLALSVNATYQKGKCFALWSPPRALHVALNFGVSASPDGNPLQGNLSRIPAFREGAPISGLCMSVHCGEAGAPASRSKRTLEAGSACSTAELAQFFAPQSAVHLLERHQHRAALVSVGYVPPRSSSDVVARKPTGHATLRPRDLTTMPAKCHHCDMMRDRHRYSCRLQKPAASRMARLADTEEHAWKRP
jgi:hypothetical protein